MQYCHTCKCVWIIFTWILCDTVASLQTYRCDLFSDDYDHRESANTKGAVSVPSSSKKALADTKPKSSTPPAKDSKAPSAGTSNQSQKPGTQPAGKGQASEKSQESKPPQPSSSKKQEEYDDYDDDDDDASSYYTDRFVIVCGWWSVQELLMIMHQSELANDTHLISTGM